MRDFIDLRQDTRLLRRHIEDAAPLREPLAFPYTAEARTIRHRDHGMALLSAISAVLAILLTSAIWIATGWPDGAFAPMMAGVGCCLYAAQDDPAPSIMSLANASIISAIGAAIYLFAVLPLATNFEMLALALAPGLLICGVMMTQPRTAQLGTGVALIGATMIAIQNGYSGDFAAFANGAVSLVVGMWSAALVTRLVRSVEGAWSAHRLRRINRRSLARAASGGGSGDGLELAAVMLDRVGLIAPRLAALPPDDAEWTADVLAEVRVGVNLVEMRRVRERLPGDAKAKIDQILAGLARHFRTDAVKAPAQLLADVDAGLEASLSASDGDARRPEARSALLGLTGLRRALFPDAPPYRPAAPKTARPELAA